MTFIETTLRNCHDFGYKNVKVINGSLAQIDFPDQSFDFVWCNGVIQHTAEHDRCLFEISRILKVGGNSWIYVYGAGGLYWYCIRAFRTIFGQFDSQKVIQALRLMRYPAPFIAEFIDDWYASYLRAYVAEDFNKRLIELGFQNPRPLKWGVDLDTSHRRNTFVDVQQQQWMGEGDLRYFLTKTNIASGNQYPLPDSALESYPYPELIRARFESHLNKLKEQVSGNLFFAVAACASLQRELRILLQEKNGLRFEHFKNHFEEVLKTITEQAH